MKNKPTKERPTSLRRSIGVKLIVAFLALSLIPMGVIAHYNLLQGQSEVARVTRENLVELSRSTAHRTRVVEAIPGAPQYVAGWQATIFLVCDWLTGKSAAPHPSPTATGRGEESGAARSSLHPASSSSFFV